MRALVMSRCLDHRGGLVAALRAYGFQVAAATTVRDAVASVVERAPAVVVVDLVGDGAREGEVLIGLLEAMTPRVPLITLSHDDLPHTAGDVDLDVRCGAREEVEVAVASLASPSRDRFVPVLH